MPTRNRCGSGEKGNNFFSIGDDFPESFSAWLVMFWLIMGNTVAKGACR
jgi:hypothetical protein